MSGSVGKISITGLREFTNAVKKVDADMPKAVRIALNAGASIIVGYARPRFPRRSGRAVSTLRAASTRTAARVREGGTKAPYVPWLDFGGRVGRKRSIRRPFIRQGRFIWRALEAERPRIVDAMTEAMGKIARDAGLEVTRGNE